MSEYQYYEFQAIDRPLTDKQTVTTLRTFTADRSGTYNSMGSWRCRS